MCRIDHPRQARRFLDLDRGHQIESEKCEVGQVVLCKSFILKVCMDTPQTAKSFGCSTRTAEIRHFDLLRVAYHHVFDLAFAVDEHADLSSGLERKLRHLPGELLRDDLGRWDAPCGEAFDTAKLVMLEALCKPRNAANKTEPPRASITKVIVDRGSLMVDR